MEWWITQGWDTLGWRGAREEADSDVIEAKIRKFLLNQKAKVDIQSKDKEKLYTFVVYFNFLGHC